MILFASVILKNPVIGLKIKWLCPGSNEIFYQPENWTREREGGKTPIHSGFVFSDIPEILGCQQEECQTATVPVEQQWSEGTAPSAGAQRLPIREKHNKHYQRNTVGEVRLGTLESLPKSTSVFETLFSFTRTSRKICFNQSSVSLRKHQLKSAVHILSLSLQGFLFPSLSTKLTAFVI